MPFTKGHKIRGGLLTRFSKGNTVNLGKKYSLERRKKIAIGRIGLKHSKQTLEKFRMRIGTKSPNWKGGISSYSSGWTHSLKKKIKLRDKNQCKLCNKRERLHVHHIDFTKSNHHPNNLITLCISCHRRIHFSSIIIEK